MFSIGQLSAKSQVKVPTIRYYEEIGLIDPPHRSEGNQRRYEPDTLQRVNFIRHGRDLGLSIEAIRDLIALGKNSEMPCAQAHQIASEHLNDLKRKIAQLKNLESELTRIASVCDSGMIGECKVLEAFGDHNGCKTEHSR